MRPATRFSLSFAAALALVISTIGAAAAANEPGPASALAGAQTMGIFHGARGSHGKPGPKTHNSNLSIGNGPVQTSPKVYISFWGWTPTSVSVGGYTYTSADAQAYITDFFNGVGGSTWNGVVTQYCDNVPVGTQDCSTVSSAIKIANPTGQLKGVWTGDSMRVPNRPSQSDIAAAAVRLEVHEGGYDPNATYMVFTPSGKSMTGFGTQWCAWHSSTSDGNGNQLAYAYIPYIPDAGSACGMNFINSNNSYGNGYFDGFSIVAGHEYSEAETDPLPSSGWVDSRGAENADKCAWSSLSGNTSFGGSHVYAVQPTWSNEISACPKVPTS
jgi:hypothetical protein